MKLHPELTLDVLERATRASMFDSDYIGFCNACGEEHDGVEPDATKYTCLECNAKEVYGAEYLFLELDAQWEGEDKDEHGS